MHNGISETSRNRERYDSQEENLQENGKSGAQSIAGRKSEIQSDTPCRRNLRKRRYQQKRQCRQNHRFPHRQSTASPSATPTPKSVRKSADRVHQRERKNQNPALSYYQTEPTETPDKKAEKEQKPTIHAETDGNRIQIEIRPDIPFQILSFRINGKECDFYWHGKKLLAELPEKTRKPWKAELLGFVKSGKLYYETMDLTEKQ